MDEKEILGRIAKLKELILTIELFRKDWIITAGWDVRGYVIDDRISPFKDEIDSQIRSLRLKLCVLRGE